MGREIVRIPFFPPPVGLALLCSLFLACPWRWGVFLDLNNHPVLRDSDRILLETFTRLNDYWGIGTHHRLELVDSTLELQQYNIHYDFDSFVGSAGFFIRNNRSQDEHGIMFNFGIKEIPSLSLPIKIGAQ